MLPLDPIGPATTGSFDFQSLTDNSFILFFGLGQNETDKKLAFVEKSFV